MQVHQFRRAVSEGMMSLLDDKLRNKIMDAYACIMLANKWLPASPKPEYDHGSLERRRLAVVDARREIKHALNGLEEFLDSTSES